ncbi:Poly(ADP-ribose) glycohydrolase [Paragonimus heterotremus]|uniref:Poly(ADP-ribose) glycohydrolase n=1 Tax=Paragonimus heterotremus TaxID=100268 RepID=A0A8J4WEH7_9TREM|nr:Poly(ADP-ribose) glycohydrolase [Paragonimus heterotremus]
MFVLRPELLAACLFMERLDDDETVIVEGVERYSISHGYADNFRWAGDYRESESGNQRDEWGRWRTTVVAMDALYFGSGESQYLPKSILRELNKAYCGFTDTLEPNRPLPSVVATGNWGCGAFRGNTDLKALIQMMACVQAGKALAYYTFGDQDLCTRLYDIYTFLASNKITVGNLWSVLATLGNTMHAHPTGLYEYIKQKLT